MRQVQDFITEQHMIAAGERVIAGVSGGADSVCLLLELLEYRKNCRFSVEVIHIEHGIRGKESISDAAFVEKLCRDFQVPFRICHFDVKKLAKEWRMTVEEAGRKVRYDTFEQMCAEGLADKIAVAHNLEDQAETILMNLARGSGVRGLCGILPVRGRIIRPLLTTKRVQIEEYLRNRGIAWCEDSTNRELDYTRNRVRLKVLPELKASVNEKAAEHIAAAGSRLLRVESYLEQEAGRLAEDMVCRENGEVRIIRTKFAQQDFLMQEYIIRYCLRFLGGGLKDIGEVHIHAVCRLAGMENGKGLALPGSITAKNKNKVLVLEKNGAGNCEKNRRDGLAAENICIPGVTKWGGYRITTSIEPAENQRIPEKKYTKWFDYDTIKYKFQIRTRQTGDYLTVNAQGGRKTLKKYLIEEKILQEERDFIPLFADGSHILWVVGHRISEAYKVGRNTRHILKVQIEPDRMEEENPCRANYMEEEENGRQDSHTVI